MYRFRPWLCARVVELAANGAATVGRSLFIATFLSLASPVPAAPEAKTQEECIVLSDMALVARSLAQEGINAVQAERIMRHIYRVAPGRGEELLKLIISQSEKETTQAPEFAGRLAITCLYSGGNLDSVLGVSL